MCVVKAFIPGDDWVWQGIIGLWFLIGFVELRGPRLWSNFANWHGESGDARIQPRTLSHSDYPPKILVSFSTLAYWSAETVSYPESIISEGGACSDYEGC